MDSYINLKSQFTSINNTSDSKSKIFIKPVIPPNNFRSIVNRKKNILISKHKVMYDKHNDRIFFHA